MSEDREIKAIEKILTTLKDFHLDERTRILRYVKDWAVDKNTQKEVDDPHHHP